jgi:copper homeostasis protein
MPKLEIAITTLEDAVFAQAGGADSVEISYDLSVGGLTPSLELVRQICDAVKIDVHVIVRPHARDFVYTPDEISVILEQTRSIAQIGITGLVFGALTADKSVDILTTQKVVLAAKQLPITFHRALDESHDAEAGVRALIGIVPRILTSGPAPTAWEGRDSLRQWVQKYGQHFRFVAAGSLKAEHLAEFASYVRAPEYHFGSAAKTDDVVNVEKVKRLRRILDTV